MARPDTSLEPTPALEETGVSPSVGGFTATGIEQRLRQKRALFIAFATAGGATLAVSFLGGLGGVIATHAIGPYQRGLLAAAVVWSSVIASLVAAGIPQATAYFVASRPERKATYASTSLLLLAGVGAALAMVGIAVSLVVGGPAEAALIVVFAGAFPLVAAGAGIGAALGRNDYRMWAVLRVVNPGVALCGIVLLVVLAGRRTAVAVASVTATAAAVQLFAVFLDLRRHDLVARPSLSSARELFAYGWRNVVAGAAWLISFKLDQLVLTVAVAPALLGIYAVSASFGELIVPVAASMGQVMLARVSARGRPEVRSSLPAALTTCVGLAVAAATVTFVLAPWLVRLLFGARFLPGVPSLRILLIGSISLATSTVLADTLRGLGRPLVPARAELVGVVCTALLLAVLVPPLGIKGAAIASTFSYTVVMVCMALLLRAEGRNSIARA